MDKDSKFPNKDDLKKFFEVKVNQSGLVLEEKVASLLYKHFHQIRRNTHYLDKDELKDRDIDFVSLIPCYVISPKKKEKPITVSFELIIECKRLPNHGWIFSGEDKDRVSIFEKAFKTKTLHHVIMPEHVSTESIPKDKHIQEIIHPLTAKLFTADGYFEGYYPYKIKENNQTKNKKEPRNFLREAILQVTKATRHRKDFQKQVFQKWIDNTKKGLSYISVTAFQPVIVFQGNMYKTIQNNDKFTLESIKFARIEKEYLSEVHKEIEGEVHIVSIDWFPEYLELIASTYGFDKPHNEFWSVTGQNKENRTGFF